MTSRPRSVECQGGCTWLRTIYASTALCSERQRNWRSATTRPKSCTSRTTSSQRVLNFMCRARRRGKTTSSIASMASTTEKSHSSTSDGSGATSVRLLAVTTKVRNLRMKTLLSLLILTSQLKQGHVEKVEWRQKKRWKVMSIGQAPEEINKNWELCQGKVQLSLSRSVPNEMNLLRWGLLNKIQSRQRLYQHYLLMTPSADKTSKPMAIPLQCQQDMLNRLSLPWVCRRMLSLTNTWPLKLLIG